MADSLLDGIPTGWERHGDLILLPKNSLEEWASYAGPELWETVAKALGGERLARKGEISGGERRPQVEMLLGENRWVTHREHGIDYSFDVTESMFSAGNLAERGRMGELDCEGEKILDLYAGIGYYTLPLLVRAGAARVHACEWSAESCAALEHNLEANGVVERCTVYAGDNRLSVSQVGSAAAILGTCDRVILGLLPSSDEGWPLAISALKPEGGTLHLHGNAPAGEEETWASATVERLGELERQRWFSEGCAGDERQVSLQRLVKVKWYAPHVRHCVLDISVK
jgi:tRNA wybutosine-synthesizing protein 3